MDRMSPLRRRFPAGILRTLLLLGVLAPALQNPLSAQTPSGRITGRIVDAQSGRALPGAQLIIEGTSIGSLAGVDGRFVISGVPAGSRDLRIVMLGFAAKVVTGLQIPAGSGIQVDVALEPAAVQVEGITVTAQQERGSVARALDEQRNALGVISAITSEEIAKSPDSDAAAAVKRVSGVSVQDGRYVIVRGLGERYTTTSLNGARVPSPEPERKVVPLDLFPSGLLQTITTAKTFTPDLPGDFSGAQVNIQTRSFPSRRQITASLSTGFTGSVTGSPILFPSSAGGEWRGMAAARRELPGLVESFGNFQERVPSQSDVNAMVRSFRNAWSVREQTGKPSGSGSLSVGGSGSLLGLDAGYLVSGTWSYSEEARLDQARAQAIATGSGGTMRSDFFEGRSGGRTTLWGGLANLSLLAGSHSRFFVNSTFNRSADDEARFEEGFDENLAQTLRIQRMRYVERTVFSSQLAGEHQFGAAHRLDWSATASGVDRSEPDRSEFVSLVDGSAPPAWFSVSNQGAVRTFGSLEESSLEGSLSYSFSYGPAGRQSRIRAGGTVRSTARDASNFAYAISGLLDTGARSLPPEQIFDGRFSADGQSVFRITPISQGGSYRAEDRIAAAYLMIDQSLMPRVRVVAGARVERSDLEVLAQSTVGESTTASPSYTDVLPSLSLNWEVTDRQTLRLSLSQTLSRPEYRELANVQFREVLGGDNVLGNPGLRRTLVRNVDARWEWYPSPGEAMTLALFAKDFMDPIERIYLGTSGTRIVTFANAEGARNFGVEAEIRTGLGRFGEAFEPLSVFSNVTVMRSEIRIGEGTDGASRTGDARPMVGQSPWVLNSGLTWAPESRGNSATLLFNSYGKRIASAAELPLPDVYEMSRHSLDLSLRFGLREGLSAKADFRNLLDAPHEFVQGSVVREFHRSGRGVSLGITWRP